MRVICAKEPFPRCWKEAYAGCDKALLEKDIKLGTLYLKLLVFKNRKELRAFWDAAEPTKNGGGVGGDTLAVVDALQCECQNFAKAGDESEPRSVMEVDKRYFAAMGLVRGYLGMEIVTHESVHAAFAYAKRLGPKTPWAKAVNGLDEEAVCYPAGRIARLVVTALNDAGLYDDNRISLNGL